ncbi:MAG: hypothetical protein HPY57_13750 [Ignavibacteria bacterium]|nr:hypothetical protein [Ignavibacteria bacterium]
MTNNVQKKLINKLLKASSEIHKKSLSSGSFIITSPQVAEMLNNVLEQLEKRKMREKKIKRIILYENIDNSDIDST